MLGKAIIGCMCLVSACITQAATTQFKGYNFESYVLSELGYRYSEQQQNNASYIYVTQDDEYSLVINNPLPVQVAVAVTIDGLNVIDGKQTSPDAAQKWMIDAYSSITLRGWQTNRSSLRRFVFTDKNGSYALWKGNRDKKAYTRNLGVIGVAYFWNSSELYTALHPPVQYYSQFDECKRKEMKAEAPAASACPKSMCEAERSVAGTGMGHTETNNVVDVAFHYNAGMYRAHDALAIYYDFAPVKPRPRPFIDDRNFAPEMP